MSTVELQKKNEDPLRQKEFEELKSVLTCWVGLSVRRWLNPSGAAADNSIRSPHLHEVEEMRTNQSMCFIL